MKERDNIDPFARYYLMSGRFFILFIY